MSGVARILVEEGAVFLWYCTGFLGEGLALPIYYEEK